MEYIHSPTSLINRQQKIKVMEEEVQLFGRG